MRAITIVALLALALPLFANGPSAGAEDAAVRAAIEHYFRGHATGDGAHFRNVFHPESKLFFIRDGKLTLWTSEEYIGRATGKPAPDEAERKRVIDWIDVTGDAAVVKLRLVYPAVTFTDYMSLLKIDGEWKIVNKTFHGARKK
ncbi:MAG TPA: nuclear transport factor 2 family protein [Thermoanaerobaculia bacterium]|jgi:hypothetical protein